MNFLDFVKLYQAYEIYTAQSQFQPQVQPQSQTPVQQVQPQSQTPVQQVQPQSQTPVQQVQPQSQTPVPQVQPNLTEQLAALQSTVDKIINRPPQVNGQPKVQTIDDIIVGLVK